MTAHCHFLTTERKK